jgi:peptidyl-prolyl cis-trans isomerase D
MLKTFRKEGVQKKILWGLAAIIIVSFVFFGTTASNVGNDPSAYAGKVFGKKVPITDFQKQYNNTKDQAIMIHGENFFKMSPYLNLESETWDRLILLTEAKRKNIKVKDGEVVEFIQSLPMFQRNGEFDSVLYKDLVRYIFRRNPRDFEEGMREQLLIRKLFEQTTASMTINEKEIREAFRRDNEKVQIDYVLFPPEDYKNGVSVNDEEAKSYFESHPDEFMTPPSVNIQYITFEYPPEAKEEDKNAVKEKVYAANRKLSAGALIENVAKENNVDVKESGMFSMEAPNIALGWSYDTMQKLFDLKVGEVSEPIETPNGYQFLKVKERRDAVLPDFNAVQTKVNEAVKTQKALAIAKQKAEEYSKKLLEAYAADPEMDFRAAAEALGLKVLQTPLFNRGQYLPTIGLSKEFQEAAYDLTEKDKLSAAPVGTAKGYVILYRNRIEPVQEEEFQKAKDKYATDLINEKRNEMILTFMNDLRLRADIQSNIPQKTSTK